ncbi:hypothetical protein ACFQZF_05930 [Flavobacterium myungsuense]|uniref:hypothetical protein n=1 Tax=Flavobacterium myungsuense TaxID=651823 RepID=UPI003639BE7D
MKIVLGLFILFTFLSCEIQYDGGTKLIVKGKIIDENNQPIANKDVKLIVSISTLEQRVFPFEENYIGRAISKKDGSFVIAIPRPINFGQIIVETNSDDNLLNQKQFVNIQMDNFENYELVLPETKLFKKTDLCTLNVELNQVDFNNRIISIDYIGEVCVGNVIFNVIDEEFWNFDSVFVKKIKLLY